MQLQPHGDSDGLAHQAHRLTDYIIETIIRAGHERLPLRDEYYYASLPLCVIDAVYSISSTYTATQNTVRKFCKSQRWQILLSEEERRLLDDRRIQNFLQKRNERTSKGEHTITEFLQVLDGLSPDRMAIDLFGNEQRTPPNKNGILKAEAVRSFAQSLNNFGIDDFIDISEDKLNGAELSVREIPGQGRGTSFAYFRMLSGDDNLIKPDRMIQRFIASGLGLTEEKISPKYAKSILKIASDNLINQGHQWSQRMLDNAIWKITSGNYSRIDSDS